MIAGRTAVHGDQRAGSRLAGVPAIDGKQWFKSATAFAKLPDLLKDVRRMKKELGRLGDQVEPPNKED